jgi:hypothetical protein
MLGFRHASEARLRWIDARRPFWRLQAEHDARETVFGNPKGNPGEDSMGGKAAGNAHEGTCEGYALRKALFQAARNPFGAYPPGTKHAPGITAR